MADPVTLQPLFLLSDEPIGVSGDDGLGMNQTARVIAEAALGAATPFTVGIFGAWGHGKTSLLNAARTLLEPVAADGTITRPHPHLVTVQFNAWRYEKEEHPIVPLVASIAKAVKQRLDDDKTFGQAVGDKGEAIATTLIDGAASLIGALRLEAKGRLGNAAVAQVEGGIGLDAGAAQKNWLERRFKRKQAAQPRVQTWIDQSLYLSAFDDLARLHAAAKKDGANVERRAPVIVVFIDDLDRCRPEAAVEILEGIKLVLAQPGFVFVLALYREVIERYLERESEVRYGPEHKAIGAGYIDKIVQLPLWLPSHEEAFEKYIRQLINTKLKPGLLPHKQDRTVEAVKSTRALLAAVYRCTPLLARLSTHSPRKLVRKINELLIDDRLLPDDAHKTIKCKPKEYRGILFPLLLIQRALQELPLPQQIKPLFENDKLCAALLTYRPELADTTDADGNVAPMLFREALKAKSQESGPRDGKGDSAPSTAAPAVPDPALKDIDAATATRLLKVTECLAQNVERAVLLNTTAGRAWLANHAARRLVAKAIATQAAPPAAPASATTQATAASKGASEAAGSTSDKAEIVSEELRQEIAIIERAARRARGKGELERLGVAEWELVDSLDLSGDPITDLGVAWLARRETGLLALTTLNLSRTQVGNAGVAALAAKYSGLTTLTTLDLTDTQVDDGGVAALAAKDSGLTALTTLNLSRTQVGNAGVAALAAKYSGLTTLTTLDLSNTKVGNAGVAVLSAKDSSLTALTTLYLGFTKVDDAGVRALVAKDSGLTALTTLYLGGTGIGNEGAAVLASKDSVLRALTTLYISGTQVGDAGVAALAAKDSGLKALTTLGLSYTKVSDAGVTALSSKDSGLTALTALSLGGTQVGDAGVAVLAAKDSGLKALTTLRLAGTQVGDAGVAALAAKDSGLMVLTTLNLSSTQVGDAGAATLAAKDSGLTVLTTLNLSSTQVGDAGAAALAAKDSGLTALTTLNLSDTPVGDAGAAALAAKDSGLTALTTLHLNLTKVTDAGAAALAAKDSGLTALTTLELSVTKVSKEAAEAIRKAHPNLNVIH